MAHQEATPHSRLRTIRRIFAYGRPHVGRIVVVACLTATYSACLTLRLGLIGLLIDGVLTSGASSHKDSIALRAYQTVARWFGAEASLKPAYPKEDAFVLLVAEGEFTEEEGTYRSHKGVLRDLWTEPPRPGLRGNAGRDRRYLRMEVWGEALRAEHTEGSTVWRFHNGRLTYTTGETLSVAQRQRYVRAFFIIAIVLAAAIGLTGFAKDYLSRRVYLSIAADIRQDIFNHLSRQSVAFFDSRKSGDLVSRFLNDAGTVQIFLQLVFGNFLEQPFTILFCIAAAFFVQPYLTLICLPFLVALFYPIVRGARRVRKHGKGRLRQLGVVTESVQQLFNGIRIIKAFNMEEEEQKNFAEQNRRYIRVAMKMEKAKITSRSLLEMLYNLGAACAVLAVGYLLALQAGRLGDFGIFLGAIFSLYRPMRRITRTYNNLQETLGGAERVFEILDQKPEVEDLPGAVELDGLRKGIEFDHVWFRYARRNGTMPVLKDICFHARMGETLGIVGPSGAGKSTLVDLIPRFYEPQRGSIRIDGIDYRSITQKSLLDHIAIVGQDPFLFNTTVRENLRYGKPAATDGEIIEAAKKAYVHDVIEALPQGYDTEIGERGATLSGGERQRLTIARALLKDAPILILDEATSALDSESERLVQEALKNLMRDRLTFLIAHRLSTLTFADRILVLVDGRIVESGTHSELLERRGEYWRFWQLQQAPEAPPHRQESL